MRIDRFCKAVDDFVRAVREKHGDHDQSTHGHGGGGGGDDAMWEERLQRNYEKFEAEAKRDVQKAERNEAKARRALKEAEGRMTAKQEVVKKLQGQVNEIGDRIAKLKAERDAADARIAALRAKLKKSKGDVLKKLEAEVKGFEKIVGDLKKLNGELDDVIKRIEEL